MRDRRLNGVKFRRQHPWPPFTLDFYAAKAKVAIEFDGGQHAERERTDEIRDRILRENGILTLRFWNHELFNDPERVLEVIWRAVQHG